jgi:hypothetical protein
VADQVGAVLDPGSFALRCADTYFLKNPHRKNCLSRHSLSDKFVNELPGSPPCF